MDGGQAVEYIARAEARRVRPLRDEAELDELDERLGRRLPAIRIRSEGGRLMAEGLARDPGHDNAGRLPVIVAFLNDHVLPLVGCVGCVGSSGRIGSIGCYRIELHDSYSYLPGRERYEEVLTFGRANDALERRVALIPDPYHMADFGGAVARASADDVPWANKVPKLFFAGTTTGDRNPSYNARLRACLWSADHTDVARMHITNVAQMSIDDIVTAHPRFIEVAHAPYAIEDHFAYRYQVNIAGNTACWSRLPMILASRSIAIHARTPHAADDAMWYYPLLREGRHYVGAESSEGPDLLRALAFCRAYDRQCRAMTDEANALARSLFNRGTAAAYLAAFLEESALWGGT
jgi:hypothetical protein